MLLQVETTHLFSPTHRLSANESVRDEQPGSRRLGSMQQTLLQFQRSQMPLHRILYPHENALPSMKISPPFI